MAKLRPTGLRRGDPLPGLRDDVLPSSYIGGTDRIQLDDGPIFTFYNLVKPETLKPEDRVDLDRPLPLHPHWHRYIAASLYSEDFVRPPGVLPA